MLYHIGNLCLAILTPESCIIGLMLLDNTSPYHEGLKMASNAFLSCTTLAAGRGRLMGHGN